MSSRPPHHVISLTCLMVRSKLLRSNWRQALTANSVVQERAQPPDNPSCTNVQCRVRWVGEGNARSCVCNHRPDGAAAVPNYHPLLLGFCSTSQQSRSFRCKQYRPRMAVQCRGHLVCVTKRSVYTLCWTIGGGGLAVSQTSGRS
jgi:hypothetical protein